MRPLRLLPILLLIAGCAGSPRPVDKSDPQYCESLGLGIGSDQYADCRLRQSRGATEQGL